MPRDSIPTRRKETKIDLTTENQIDDNELAFRKTYACFLKAGGHSYSEISDYVRATRRLVRRWFEDEEMKARVVTIQENIVEGTLDFMSRSAMEAAQIVLASARGALRAGSWKDARDGGEAILDRVGLSKVNKSESKATTVKEHRHGLDDDAFDKLEGLPHETQVKIAELMQEVQVLVSEAQGTE